MSDPLHIWSVDRMLVCVPALLPDATVARLRALLAGRPSADAVLELLTADGLGATPPFLCAEVTADGVRIVIRGDLEAVAQGRDGSSLALDAGRAATWNDDVVSDVASIAVDLGERGGRFEWIAAVGAAAPTAAPPHAPPGRVAEPHTLGEEEFLRLVAGEEPAAGPEPDAEPEPINEPEPTPERGPAPSPPTSPPSPAAPSAVEEVHGDALDFSSLLDHTSSEGPATAAPPPPPRLAPVPDPGPAPAADPTLVHPADVVAPAPATRVPISAVPPSAGAAAPVPGGPAAGSVTGLGEHDGRTVTLADLRRLQEDAGAGAPAATTRPDPGAAVRPSEVRAVRCPAGHPNPPTATSCRLCGAAVTDTTVASIPRPVIARLVFDSGLVVDVDRPQLIGRRPTAPPDAEEIPNLVTIPSPDSDISRVHTAVRVEGWDVLVEDAGSTNGTEVRQPGRDPVRLREHDPVLVVEGTEVTLAGTVRFRIDAPEQQWS